MGPATVLGAFSAGAELLQCRVEDGDVSAMVAMRRVLSRAGTPWLALSVPICPVESIRLRAALVTNDALVVGALALREGAVLLRQTLPLASLTVAALEQTLIALVRT